jgi:hypothetical protein
VAILQAGGDLGTSRTEVPKCGRCERYGDTAEDGEDKRAPPMGYCSNHPACPRWARYRPQAPRSPATPPTPVPRPGVRRQHEPRRHRRS